MALQEICDVLDFTSDSRSNDTPATSGMTMEDQFVHFGPRTRRDFFSGSNSVSPLNFYIPVAEYLEESPIQFGQISPSLSPISIPTAHIISPQDSILPSLFCPPVAPPSPYSPSVPLPFPMSHGTTTLAFLFQGGVIAAADTRSSCSGLVACPASQKILPVHSHLVGTTSGTSADCALWKRILARELRLYQLRYGRRLSTGGAAKLLAHMLHPFKGTELCVAATLCGWDGGEVEGCTECHRDQVEDLMEDHGQTEGGRTRDLQSPSEPLGVSLVPPVAWRKTQCLSTSARGQRCSGGGRQGFSGPSLYYVCSDGTRLQGELFSVGSGSPYAYSVLDGEVRWGLSVEQAVSVAREAVYRATHRDAYSGNCVDLYHVTAKGWTRRRREELKEEYYREKERERDKVKERKERQEGTQDGDSENDKGGTGVSIAKVTSLSQQ